MRLAGLWLSLSVLLWGGAVWAQDKPDKPETPLTAQEISDGWIMLFDGNTDFGWKMRGDSKWTVAEESLQASEGGAGVISTKSEFGNFLLHAECWTDGKSPAGLFLRGPVADGPITTANAYEIMLDSSDKKWPVGSVNSLARSRSKVKTAERWTSFDVRAEGDHLIVMVDGKKAVDTHPKNFARGVFALAYGGAGTVRFRNLRLQPLSLKSIFNGKDLTGWKPITGPDHHSVFSVTPEGTLNIKSGNGDIQTEGKWGDFVLQSEVYSQSDHCNSGIFFRANPGGFWSGYECQIRNQWFGHNRNAAFDYGTGGIYNRQPARRVVSSDREWYTVTIVACGFHIATWVNGYQVADVVDKRPVDQTNARHGARWAAGVVSLQGHDQNGDISYRKIRVIELPPARSEPTQTP